MSVETHLNTYIQEAEQAYKEAVAALDNFYQKTEALKGKFAQHVSDIATAVGTTVPEVEALVPQAKPAAEEAEKVAQEAEHVVNQVTQDEGKTSKAKS